MGFLQNQRKKYTVALRDNFTCQYCGKSLIFMLDQNNDYPDLKVEVDHVKSRSSGGNTSIHNLVTVCSKCNRCKGSRSTEDFLTQLHPQKTAEQIRDIIAQIKKQTYKPTSKHRTLARKTFVYRNQTIQQLLKIAARSV